MESLRITNLGCKEVINICDGTRYGYVNDAEIDITTGEVVAVIVPGHHKFPWFFSRYDDYIIPWKAIRRIGDDIILVDYQLKPRQRREKRTWFSR